MIRTIIQKLRDITPLKWRIAVGPYIAYVNYKINTLLLTNRKRPHVLSLEETISKTKKENLSIIRFGDGEMSLIANHDLAFQKSNPLLSEKLSIVLQSNDPKLLICIPGVFESLNNFNKTAFWFFLHHLFKYGYIWKNLLGKNQVYGDAFITRPYLTYKDKSLSSKIFSQMMSLWENEDVVLIEGTKSRLGVGNDLFKNVKSMGRILCPPENAFSKYNEILETALKTDKNKLILISLGPTAKVLGYEMFLQGYRVIDIGHIDMEYEMYLNKQDRIVKIKYKYFNEIEERNPEECLDEQYTNEIISKIE